MGRKLGWGSATFLEGGAGTPSNTVSSWPRPTSVPVASRSMQPFGHNRNGPKIGQGLRPLLGRGLGPHLTHSLLGHLDPSRRLTTISMGRKIGGSAPFLGRGAGSPSNIKSPGLRPTSMPTTILIHAVVLATINGPKNWGLCPF